MEDKILLVKGDKKFKFMVISGEGKTCLILGTISSEGVESLDYYRQCSLKSAEKFKTKLLKRGYCLVPTYDK